MAGERSDAQQDRIRFQRGIKQLAGSNAKSFGATVTRLVAHHATLKLTYGSAIRSWLLTLALYDKSFHTFLSSASIVHVTGIEKNRQRQNLEYRIFVLTFTLPIYHSLGLLL